MKILFERVFAGRSVILWVGALGKGKIRGVKCVRALMLPSSGGKERKDFECTWCGSPDHKLNKCPILSCGLCETFLGIVGKCNDFPLLSCRSGEGFGKVVVSWCRGEHGNQPVVSDRPFRGCVL